MRNKLLLCSRIFYTLWFLVACFVAYFFLSALDFTFPGEAILFCAVILFLISAFLTPYGLFYREAYGLLFHIGIGLYIISFFIASLSDDPTVLTFLLAFLILLPDLCGELFLLLKKKRFFFFICSIVLNSMCLLIETAVIVMTFFVFTVKPENIEGNVVFVWLVMSIYALFSLMHRLGFFFCLLDAWKHRPRPVNKVFIQGNILKGDKP